MGDRSEQNVQIRFLSNEGHWQGADGADNGNCMELKAAVEKYLGVVKEFGRPMPLASFGLPRKELEAMVSAWEEDYHLHRHFELIPPATPMPDSREAGDTYVIRGITFCAIVFKESIRHAFDK